MSQRKDVPEPEHLSPKTANNNSPPNGTAAGDGENEMTQNETAMVADEPGNAVEVGRRIKKIHETPVNMLYEVPDGRGGTTTKNLSKTPKNVLLYKHGLYSLVQGDPDEIYVLSQEPYAAVSPTEDDSSYVIWVGEDSTPVHTPPEKERRVLEVIRDIVEDGGMDAIDELEKLQVEILDSQVRRNVVNKLLSQPPFSQLVERGVLEATGRGWLFHGSLLLTWEGEFRNKNDHEGGFEVSGSGVRQVESANDAFRLRQDRGDNPTLDDFEESDTMSRHKVQFEDGAHTFGRQEFGFVTHAIWALKNVNPRGANAANDNDTEHSHD